MIECARVAFPSPQQSAEQNTTEISHKTVCGRSAWSAPGKNCPVLPGTKACRSFSQRSAISPSLRFYDYDHIHPQAQKRISPTPRRQADKQPSDDGAKRTDERTNGRADDSSSQHARRACHGRHAPSNTSTSTSTSTTNDQQRRYGEFSVPHPSPSPRCGGSRTAATTTTLATTTATCDGGLTARRPRRVWSA